GTLNGIIHCAGILHDGYILGKTPATFKSVLAPKVAGTLYLDHASRNLPLDFFVLFSSTAGALGNPGQVDYATANAFLDAFAEYRNGLRDSQQRHGQTLSIDWPLWKEGGMRVDEPTARMIEKTVGMMAMSTSAGLEAFYRSLASGLSEVLVMEGDLSRMKAV